MAEDMIVKILLGVNAVLMTCLGFFVKFLINKMDKKIEAKLDAVLCAERHGHTTSECTALFRHKHAERYADGRGGEVIIP